MSKKIDNGNLASKLMLRKHFLDLYKPVSVLDCCAGKQVLWKELRKTFDVDYLGLDKKDIPGSLKMDSINFLRRGNGRRFDVVDIDTYGSPFRHLAAMSMYLEKPTTVFLTFGGIGISNVQGEVLSALGIDFSVPLFLATELTKKHINEVIGGIIVPHICEYARESPPNILGGSQPTRYIGMRLSPAKK